MKILLSHYVLSIKKHRAEELEILESFADKRDFADFFERFLVARIADYYSYTSHDRIRVFLTSNLYTKIDKGRTFYGYFKGGFIDKNKSFTVRPEVSDEDRAMLRDRDTKISPELLQSQVDKLDNIELDDHLELKNFFYYAHIPKGKNRAHFILQDVDGWSVIRRFYNALKFDFRKEYPNYALSFDRQVNYTELKTALEYGEIKGFNAVAQFRNSIVPSGSAAMEAEDPTSSGDYKDETMFIGLRGDNLVRFGGYLQKALNSQKIPALLLDGEETIPEDLEFEVEYNGRTLHHVFSHKSKTTYLNAWQEIKNNYDIQTVDELTESMLVSFCKNYVREFTN